MKRLSTTWLLALGLCGIIGTIGCATTRAPNAQLDDAKITTKVQAKIAADPSLNPFEIDVDTKNRVVHLTGTVETESDRAEAERHARDTRGVSEVRNDIELGDPTLGENITDAWIVTKIKTKLVADPAIQPFNVDVDVVRGVVTLSGTVEKLKAKTEAEKLARATKGVKNVRNMIEVR